MAQQSTEVEVWIVVDANGDAAIGGSANEAKEHYTEDIGALEDSEGFRMVRVLVKVPLPEVSTVELTAEAPALSSVEALTNAARNSRS